MTVLFGTSATRFSAFEDPNTPLNGFLKKGFEQVNGFIKKMGQIIAEPTFVEDGVSDVAGFSNYDAGFSDIKEPSRRSVFSQNVNTTIFIKKRIFSSLGSNFDARFMSEEDKIFIRASKHLFRRKCEEISFYENIAKLESLNDSSGFLKIDGALNSGLDAMFGILNIGAGLGGLAFDNREDVLQLAAMLDEFSSPGGQFLEGTVSALMDVLKVIYKLKQVNDRSKGSVFTRWVYDPSTVNHLGTGPGVGVIELCLASRLSTRNSLESNSASLSVQDPYRLTNITEYDIEVALRQAFAEEGGMATSIDVGASFQLEQAMELDRQLNELRRLNSKSEINFEFLVGSAKVVGKLIELNQEFDEYTVDALPSDQALSYREQLLALSIINKLSSYIAIQQRATKAFQDKNEEFAGIRQRMRNEYVGNSIIQPMDTVSIFVNSNTRAVDLAYENRPDFTTDDFLQSLAENYNVMDASIFEQEALVYGIHPSLYKLIRKPDYWRPDGTCVYTGLVDSVSTQYSNGSFYLEASVTSNLNYLAWTKINTAPSLAQPTKFLDDPLTPFDIDVNSASGLIESAPRLSRENRAKISFLRLPDGLNPGKTVSDESELFIDLENAGQKSRHYLQHVPGLVYKWKHGIVTETLDVNVDRALDGTGSALNTDIYQVPVTLTTNPFADMDVADAISILVTGRPYNYGNFLNSAIASTNYSINAGSGQDYFFNNLFNIYDRQKFINGDFTPAKSSIIDPKQMSEIIQKKSEIQEGNSQLVQVQRELANKIDQVTRLSMQGNPDSQALIEEYKQSILLLQTKVRNSGNTLNGLGDSRLGGLSVNTVGNSVMINFPEVEQDLVAINAKIAHTIRRKPEDVRFNTDKNYFIVSNQYDQDTDVQAFALALRSLNGSLMSSTYKNALDLSKDAAKTLNFEFFADNNGNIIFRPPEYNKTPLSLLLKMLTLQKGDGTSLAPKFILDLFQNKVNAIQDRLLEVELKILEKQLLLSIPDSDLGFSLAIKDPFKDGTSLGGDQVSTALAQGQDGNQFYLSVPDVIKQYLSPPSDALSPAVTADIILKSVNEGGVSGQLATGSSDKSTEITKIIRVKNQLAVLTGRLDTYLSASEEDKNKVRDEMFTFDVSRAGGAVKRVTALQDLSVLVSERQMLVSTFGKTAKNYQYVQGAETAGTFDLSLAGVWDAFKAKINPKDAMNQLPEALKDLVENDLANEEGPRSGKRFVIYDDQVIEYGFTHTPPQYNRVSVAGNTDGNGNIDIRGGNIASSIPRYFKAEAVDFDSWRQYGLRESTQEFHRVDFSNANSQCAPYAVFKLLEQRKEVHSGSITVVGNEYYKAGDVVYINSKSMLFYVTEVSHKIDISRSVFTTTLSLKYGRSLGEYLPTPLDVIGKNLLSAQRRAYGDISVKRFAENSNDIFNLGTLKQSNFLQTNDGTDITQDKRDSLTSVFLKENKEVIKRIFATAASSINESNKDYARIELRSYYTAGPMSVAATNDLLLRAKSVIVNILSKTDIYKAIPVSSIVAMPPIDISAKKALSNENKKFRRFPSEAAWAFSIPDPNSDNIPLPIGVVDVVFVVDKPATGNR